MTDHKTLRIVLPSGEVEDAPFSMSRGDPCVVEIRGPGDRVLRAEASDLFDCLVKIRMVLEVEGAKVLCNGARVDAYPSPMGRDMGGGRKVYLMTMGQAARPEDLVNTFDAAPIESIGTVADQRRFYLDWLKSVGP